MMRVDKSFGKDCVAVRRKYSPDLATQDPLVLYN
jgi:hypothetical protein